MYIATLKSKSVDSPLPNRKEALISGRFPFLFMQEGRGGG